MDQSRAVVYLRISLDRTGDEAGVRRQREDCERRARERGWTVVEVLSDNDVSASGKRRRPGFERLLTAIAEGSADIVIAWALDRLQRSRRDELRLYELCHARGVVVSLVRGPDLDWSTPAGRFIADTLSATARLEIEAKSDRHKRANRQAALAGQRRSGRRPFGYESDGVTIREPEAAALRDAYASFLAGVTLAGICRTLDESGFTTGAGGRWTPSTLGYVLANPRYAGLRGYAPLPGIGEPPLKGRPVIEVVGPAQWPGIVEEETWQAAVAKLKDPARRQAPKSGKGLLSGLAKCGRCGAVVWLGVATSAKGGYRVYRCSAARHLTRKAEPVEAFVSAVAVARLAWPDAVELTRTTARTPDVEALRLRAQAARARLDELAALFADGVLTRSGVEAASERLRAELSQVEAELADAGRVSLLGPLAHPGDADAVRLAWDALGTDRQRVVIDALMTATLLPPKLGNGPFDPETVGIEWRSE
jgi:site-specific DNA recombinase